MTDGDIMFIEEVCQEEPVDSTECEKKKSCDDVLEAVESQIVIIPGQFIPADEMPDRPSVEHLTFPDQCKRDKDCNYKKVCVPNWLVEGYKCVDLCKARRVIQKWIVRSPQSFKKFDECNLTIEPEATCPPQPQPQPPTEYVHDLTKENHQIMKLRYFMQKYCDPNAFCDNVDKNSSDEEEFISGSNESQSYCNFSEQDSEESVYFCEDECACSFNSNKKCFFVKEPMGQRNQTIEKKSHSYSTDSMYGNTDDQCFDEYCEECGCSLSENRPSSAKYYANCQINSGISIQQSTASTKEKNDIIYEEETEKEVKNNTIESIPEHTEKVSQSLLTENAPKLESEPLKCEEPKIPEAPKSVEKPVPQNQAAMPEKQKNINNDDECAPYSIEDENSADCSKQASKKRRKFNCSAALGRLRRKMRRSGGQNILPFHLDENSHIFACSRSNATIDVQNLNYNGPDKVIFDRVITSPLRSMTTQRIVSKTNSFKTLIEEANMRSYCICCLKPKHTSNNTITSTSTLLETLSNSRCISNNRMKSFQSMNSCDKFYEKWFKNSSQKRLHNNPDYPYYPESYDNLPTDAYVCRHLCQHCHGSRKMAESNPNYNTNNIAVNSTIINLLNNNNNNTFPGNNRSLNPLQTLEPNRATMRRNLGEWQHMNENCCHLNNYKNINNCDKKFRNYGSRRRHRSSFN